MSLSIFSQDTERITIKRSTLESIIKESKKCDSLRNAYFQQSKSFDELIASNNKMFADFEATRSEKIKLQETLTNKETELKKLFQKPNRGWLVPVLVGVTIGVVLGAI